MEKETLDRLRKEYNNLSKKGKETALKLHYLYNEVNVNVYVDFWDPECPMMQLLLVLNQGVARPIYYLQAVNVFVTGEHKKYLEDLSPEFCGRLIDSDNSLKKFYNDMDVRLRKEKLFAINIAKEVLINNTRRYKKNRKEIYPYLHYLRRVGMSDTHYEELQSVLSIDEDILDKIRDSRYTIVTTPDPSKRVTLQVLLDGMLKVVD